MTLPSQIRKHVISVELNDKRGSIRHTFFAVRRASAMLQARARFGPEAILTYISSQEFASRSEMKRVTTQLGGRS